MNRPIKFRGKCLECGDWVCGDLIHGVGHKAGNIYILPNTINLATVKHCDPLDGVKVDPKTVGEFTGYKDKDGADIFEGDWLSIAPSYACHVVFRNGMFMTIYTHPEDGEEIELADHFYSKHNVKIVGTIHDNTQSHD